MLSVIIGMAIIFAALVYEERESFLDMLAVPAKDNEDAEADS